MNEHTSYCAITASYLHKIYPVTADAWESRHRNTADGIQDRNFCVHTFLGFGKAFDSIGCFFRNELYNCVLDNSVATHCI